MLASPDFPMQSALEEPLNLRFEHEVDGRVVEVSCVMIDEHDISPAQGTPNGELCSSDRLRCERFAGSMDASNNPGGFAACVKDEGDVNIRPTANEMADQAKDLVTSPIGIGLMAAAGLAVLLDMNKRRSDSQSSRS
jgi:hypothetical protein